MAGNYQYYDRKTNRTFKPEEWFVGDVQRTYIATYCVHGMRIRTTYSELWMVPMRHRIFNIKAWGKDGYK